MRGRKRTYVVELKESEKLGLQQLVLGRNSPQGEVQRAKVILTCAEHPDWPDAQVGAAVGCSANMVRKWRKRWSQTHSLKEAPRSGRPRVFPPEARVQATAVACTQPEEMGVPLSRWSCAEVAAKLVALQGVGSIATSTGWRWFKAEKIKPWRYHFWQHPIDPQFMALAIPVLRLYEQAMSLLKEGT